MITTADGSKEPGVTSWEPWGGPRVETDGIYAEGCVKKSNALVGLMILLVS
jgi:hypothetical protein